MSSKDPQLIENIDQDLLDVLEGLYFRDEDITARAAARLHPKKIHPSTITRSARATLIARYQVRQNAFRAHVKRLRKISRDNSAAELAKKDEQIKERDRQLEILQASSVATIRVLGEMGGMSKLLKFFEQYREIRDRVTALAETDNFGTRLKIP